MGLFPSDCMKRIEQKSESSLQNGETDEERMRKAVIEQNIALIFMAARANRISLNKSESELAEAAQGKVIPDGVTQDDVYDAVAAIRDPDTGYGQCQVYTDDDRKCGNIIPTDRLESTPFHANCVDCQRLMDRVTMRGIFMEADNRSIEDTETTEGDRGDGMIKSPR